MHTRPPSRIPWILLLLFAVLPGCAAGVVAGAAGGYAALRHHGNQQSRSFQAPLRATYDAALVVLPELGYPRPQNARLGPTEASMTAGSVRVAMASYPEGVTRVAVRVGTFESADNRRRTALVLERIGARLGQAPRP